MAAADEWSEFGGIGMFMCMCACVWREGETNNTTLNLTKRNISRSFHAFKQLAPVINQCTTADRTAERKPMNNAKKNKEKPEMLLLGKILQRKKKPYANE